MLAIDGNIKKIGIYLASRCYCCMDKGVIETKEHSFGSRIFFSKRLEVRYRSGKSIFDYASLWWSKAKSSSHLGIMRGLIPTMIIRRLWLF